MFSFRRTFCHRTAVCLGCCNHQHASESFPHVCHVSCPKTCHHAALSGCANGNVKPFNPTPSLPREMVCTASFRSTRGHSPSRSRNAPPLERSALPTSAISRSQNRRQGTAQRFGSTSVVRVFCSGVWWGVSLPSRGQRAVEGWIFRGIC